MDETPPQTEAPAAPPPAELRELTAPDEAHGERLDRWMASLWPDLSRSRCKALVEAGNLFMSDAPMTDPSAKVRGGESYRLELPPPRPAEPTPEAMNLDILFEDEHLIVINKPAGMTVHPAAGNWTGTLVHGLLHHCAGQLSGIGGVERPGIVHRIDKDTSGVLVVAKSNAAHQGLSKLFETHTIERTYLALVRGAPKPREGRIETRLARSDHDRKKMAVVRERPPKWGVWKDKPPHKDKGRRPGVRSPALEEPAPEKERVGKDISEKGKLAITNYRVVRSFGQVPDATAGTPVACMVECRLETGRTHQIRVHLTHIGCPLLGDPLYGRQQTLKKVFTAQGEELKEFRRQALHAASLGFVHPITGEDVFVETGPPKDMQRLIKFLERL